MKLINILLMFLLLSISGKTNPQFKTITFNIRYGTADDGNNSWQYRKDLVFSFINKQDADFIGLQEAMLFQIEEIINHCPGYDYIGRTRQPDGEDGEACPILYRPQEWDLLRHETKWLSKTPDVPGSQSWDAAFPRIFTRALFKNKATGREVVIYNTHYDHASSNARDHSSKTLISDVRENFPDHDIVILGDFNATPNQEPITYLLTNKKITVNDAYKKLNPESKNQGATYYGWGEHIPGQGRRIDYIFYTGNLSPLKCYVSDYNENGRYPSDHLPVVAIFK